MRSVFLIFTFALALLVDLTNGYAQRRVVTRVVLQAPSVNVQQTYAYGERRGLSKQEGLDLRIVVIRPHLATATLLSGEDPYAYVLGPTEMTSLKALNRYQIEQGLMKRELDIPSLFVRGTI